MNVISDNVIPLVPSVSESFITCDMTYQQVAILQLRKSLPKKYQPKGHNLDADKAALDLFIESNARCFTWQPDETSYHYNTMLRAREKLAVRLNSGELQAPRVSLRNCSSALRPGPGSSLGTKLTDFVGKLFHSELTTYDKHLWEYYKGCVSGAWLRAESFRSRSHGPCKVVRGSRLTFAKKNYDISRVINTEAGLDMLFQLAMGVQIESCLEDWFNINLSKQPTIHRYLAYLGSKYGEFATIDLKSASDTISEAFVRWLLPKQTFLALDTVRAKCIELPSGEYLQLGTFSTMGNGFTFPLQTLIFSCIVEAAYEELGLSTWNFGQVPSFSVFGDDIVCVGYAYEKILSLLGWCGFIVNKDKSFNSGSFRESCGSDFYKGHDVRGVYCKGLYHETHFYSLFNRLTRWSIRNRVCLDHCLRYLLSRAKFLPVPFDVGDDAGIKVPLSLSGKDARNGLVRFKCLTAKARKVSTRAYESNPDSILVGALGGYIEGTGRTDVLLTGNLVRDSVFKPFDVDTAVGSITLRAKPDGIPRVVLKKHKTPSWDFVPHTWLTARDYEISLMGVL